MKKIGFLLVFALLAMCSQAQSESTFDGKYTVKFSEGGFEDSIVIHGDTLIHILNQGWGYGVEWQFIYNMVHLNDDWIQFEQIGLLRDRVAVADFRREGSLNLIKTKLRKLESGDLEIVYESQPESSSIFTRVSN